MIFAHLASLWQNKNKYLCLLIHNKDKNQDFKLQTKIKFTINLKNIHVCRLIYAGKQYWLKSKLQTKKLKNCYNINYKVACIIWAMHMYC